MLRTEVIQAILNAKTRPAYLEIGVKRGENFFPIRAGRKIAVDPVFAFSLRERIRWMYKNPSNLTARYYQVTSDEYFSTAGRSRKLDVVFIDGLHTYRQSLKDVLNALNVLNEGGVIVMHDCNPPHKAAAFPSETPEEAAASNVPGWTGEWCGDVWKTVCHLRSARKDLRVFVLNCDYGLGVITRGRSEDALAFSTEQVEKMTYDDLAENRERILGLKDERYLFDFLKTL